MIYACNFPRLIYCVIGFDYYCVKYILSLPEDIKVVNGNFFSLL